jgi:trans-aconitate methyltransferase
MFNLTNIRIANAYNKSFKKHGALPEASFWYSGLRQQVRFDIISKEIDKISKNDPISICDLGCGYGAYSEYISKKTTPRVARYIGIDLSKQVIRHCNENISHTWAEFKQGSEPTQMVDFTIMSGTFNYAVTKSVDAWENYIFRCLEKCWLKTQQAIIFNLQITHQKKTVVENKIYFAEPLRTKKLCESKFGETKYVSNTLIPKDGTFVIMK